MRCLLIIFAAVFFISNLPKSKGYHKEWEKYKKEFNKKYSNVEEARRMKLFIKKMKEIEEHNVKYRFGLVSWTKGLNVFSDMTRREVKKSNGCYNVNKTDKSRKQFKMRKRMKLPRSIDWRQLGAVTKVKYQGGCGACYAFSSAGAMEALFFKQTGRLEEVSIQNILDCSTKFGNGGCSGGGAPAVFDYVMYNGGVNPERSYPFTGRDGSCKFDPNNVFGSVSDVVAVPEGNEGDLQMAVATQGPVVIAVDSTGMEDYTGDIYDNPNCKNDIDHLDHALLVVGYGTNDAGQDYWIAKNSWGDWFGEKGYIYLSRNKNNQCGVATYAHYPIG